jgi:hypothetical protein
MLRQTDQFAPAAVSDGGHSEGKREKNPGRVFKLCPVRHTLLGLSAIVILGYFLLRDDKKLMETVSEGFVRPYHRLAGRVSGLVGFSIAEIFYAVLLLGVLIYLARAAVLLIRHDGRAVRVYRTIVSLLTAAAMLYAGACVLWGVYYYAHGFSERIGIDAGPVAVQDLENVTVWFAGLANQYASEVSRDENEVYTADLDSLFTRSETLYEAMETKYPTLEGPALKAKPMIFSKLMSWINFTGFFFPFTGEANLNIESPVCMLPATIAHEQAHQRGVAGEDEANFVAVAACLESGDPDFIYSASLLAYIHLGNALHDAKYDAWIKAYTALGDNVQRDLRVNNDYWAQYQSKVSEVSEAVYTEFLRSQGQELGMQSYGACVDHLVAYYKDDCGNIGNQNG